MTRPYKNVQVPEGYLAVGYITGAHGLAGEVKVELYTDYPERFAPGVVLFVGDDLEQVEIQHARPHKAQMLLTLTSITDRTAAEGLRGQWLFVDEQHAARLDKDTYWVHDILGMTVVLEGGETLGLVKDVLFTGANEVYVVRPVHAEDGAGELLLPAIADVVQRVDLAARTMTVRLLPGLRPEP